jgi:hypothetical protein
MRRASLTRLTAAQLFNVRDALNRAERILMDPPARQHIVRVRPDGELVVRFALPLELCEPQNRRRGAPGWAMAQKREDILQLFAVQLRHQLPLNPLPGRPIVQCVRFSARAPDAFADSFKLAVDCLSPSRVRRFKGVPRKIPGIGLIVDDRPEVCDVRQRWEYAAAKTGFAVVEVWTGKVEG